MIKQFLRWTVGYTKYPSQSPQDMVPATVPGAAQLDYARANNWDDYNFGANFQQYAWMEDVYWLYRAELNFTLENEQCAQIVFGGIDYRYDIRIDGQDVFSGEGMFTPVRLDVTHLAGAKHQLEVLIYPVPKADESNTRSQARRSCKPAACYGWDWHPRLISVGLWEEAFLCIQHRCALRDLRVKYEVADALDTCTITVEAVVPKDCTVQALLLDESAQSCAQAEAKDGETSLTLTVNQPRLWNPIGYGAQTLYTLRVSVLDAKGQVLDVQEKRMGLRRVRLVMNEGSWKEPCDMPKSRSAAPATLEINGQRIFAKGSNWVNAHIFPGEMDDALYADLLTLVKDAHMNLLRIWGGGFVNKEKFFELCDEMGIMVWQEFPLACNEYPDDPEYLRVLEQEARSIVRRLRTHPSLVLYCGGNELFNSWSGMTEQHHALRLLDKICYEEDRFTPFNMTSPLNGMAHGHYLNYDRDTGKEAITTLVQSHNTAYTEFGSPGAADLAYIHQYISDRDYADFKPENDVWTGHHAFNAWTQDSWVATAEVNYFFGGYRNTDDLLKKTQWIQAMGYRSLFEEMRRQWPHCSMALNWCLNEPWPTFANNSLISFPAQPKPSYYAVKEALRPRLASLKINKHLNWAGEDFCAEIWLLNDTLETLEKQAISVSYAIGSSEPVYWGTLSSAAIPSQENLRIGALSFPIPKDFAGMIHVHLHAEGAPEMDSDYSYPCRIREVADTSGMLNV